MNWLRKFKYQYAGSLPYTAEMESALLRQKWTEQGFVHLWENGFGHRRLTGDYRAIERMPSALAWKSGKPITGLLTTPAVVQHCAPLSELYGLRAK